MYTDIRIHELTLGYEERERAEHARLRELHRIAGETRISAITRLRARLGTLLIATGEALRRGAAPASTGHVERPETLSQARM